MACTAKVRPSDEVNEPSTPGVISEVTQFVVRLEELLRNFCGQPKSAGARAQGHDWVTRRAEWVSLSGPRAADNHARVGTASIPAHNRPTLGMMLDSFSSVTL